MDHPVQACVSRMETPHAFLHTKEKRAKQGKQGMRSGRQARSLRGRLGLARLWSRRRKAGIGEGEWGKGKGKEVEEEVGTTGKWSRKEGRGEISALFMR